VAVRGRFGGPAPAALGASLARYRDRLDAFEREAREHKESEAASARELADALRRARGRAVMADIEIRNVVKRYGKVTAVHGIDLTVGDGEFVVLVGPSGCGKSTTLRMVAGLEEISGGTIRIGGRVVNQLEPKDRNIAMVFQNYAIYPHMSVAKNIAFGLYTARSRKPRSAGAWRRPRAPGPRGAPRAAPLRIVGRAAPARRDRARDGARSRPPSCSTSPCRTSTRSCAPRCGSRSSACTSGSAPPSCS
jgi:ABC-type dipeptide/oligopeptide/nickel transport system ATPase component